MVPEAGLEPARYFYRGILRLNESQKAQYIVKCDFLTYNILCFFSCSSNPVFSKMNNKHQYLKAVTCEKFTMI